MELLRRAQNRFRSTKQVLLAREQFIKNVWDCTRIGFGVRKLPAETTPRQNVLYLSSGMPQGAETIVFVVPEKAMALKLRVLSSENLRKQPQLTTRQGQRVNPAGTDVAKQVQIALHTIPH